mmetsp:Transcript_54500/g.162856  ORF Transcript_54500/g.162856 Transcript_54500/m.162856 type:complete len:229 (-) Transcript_54500:489-1175(-)
MTSGPTLYHVPKTISSPIVQFLIEAGLATDPVNIETLTFPDLKKPAHLAINPMGSSPAFKNTDNDIVMWESGAILTYLLETYDQGNKYHPAIGSPQRAKFLQIQQYLIATVYPFIAALFIHTLKPEEEQDAKYVDSAKEKWRSLLAPTLSKALLGQPYFLGESPSAIDFVLAKPLNNVNSLGMLEETPSLKAHFERISSLPSFSKAYAIEDSKSGPTDQTLTLVPSRG